MKKFEQYGTLLTRSEAKEIKGGQDSIENPVTDITDPGSGGGGGMCSMGGCVGDCTPAGGGAGMCMTLHDGRCFCSPG